MTPVHPNAVREGDLIEAEVGGISFEATIKSKSPKVCGIEPTDPYHHQRRFCDYTQIVRVISRPADGEAVA